MTRGHAVSKSRSMAKSSISLAVKPYLPTSVRLVGRKDWRYCPAPELFRRGSSPLILVDGLKGTWQS